MTKDRYIKMNKEFRTLKKIQYSNQTCFKTPIFGYLDLIKEPLYGLNSEREIQRLRESEQTGFKALTNEKHSTWICLKSFLTASMSCSRNGFRFAELILKKSTVLTLIPTLLTRFLTS